MLRPGLHLRISRPRFWIYLLGPYLLGLAAAVETAGELLRYDSVVLLLFAIYFLFPANLLVYGINDLYDEETDRLNPKKSGYEVRVAMEERWPLKLAIFSINLPFASLALYLEPAAAIALGLFFFFSIFYSAPPIRAKTKPILDSAFNVLYIFPGIFSFLMITGYWPPLTVILAGWLWTMAMHAFSAVPDITADREAGISTVATLLDRNGTIVLCSALYLTAAVLAFPYLGSLAAILGGAYIVMMAVSLKQQDEASVFSVYKWFPLVNAAAGFAVFWYIFLPKTIQSASSGPAVLMP